MRSGPGHKRHLVRVKPITIFRLFINRGKLMT